MPVGLSQFYKVIESGADRIMMTPHGDGLLGTPDKTSFNGYSLEALDNLQSEGYTRHQISAKKEFASYVNSNIKVLKAFKGAIEAKFGASILDKLDPTLFSPKTSLTPKRFHAIMRAVNESHHRSLAPKKRSLPFFRFLGRKSSQEPTYLPLSKTQDVLHDPSQTHGPHKTHSYRKRDQLKAPTTPTTLAPKPRPTHLGVPKQEMPLHTMMPPSPPSAPLKRASGQLLKTPVLTGHPGVSRNGAQTCYLGSTINMLCHTPGYRALFDQNTVAQAYQIDPELDPTIQDRHRDIQALAGLMREAFAKLDQDGVPQSLVTQIFNKMKDLKLVPQQATTQQQMDIEEVVNALLDIYTPSNRLQEQTITTVNPTTIVETDVTAKDDEYSTIDSSFQTPKLSQPSSILKLPVGRSVSLQECLTNYQKSETLDDFAIRQNGHKANCTARRRIKLSGRPDQLTINLKRHTDHRHKIEHEVEIPQQLKFNGATYELRAMAFHHGNSKGGHYTTAVKEEDGWYHHDDGQTHQITGGLFGEGNQGYRNGGYLYTYVKIEDPQTQHR